MNINKNIISRIRKKVSRGEVSIGSWLQIDSSRTAALMSQSGYDWLVIDTEHGHFSNSSLPNLCSLIESSNVAPFVRVSSKSEIIIRHALDAGAYGIIVPNVSTLDDLQMIKDSVFFPPKGKRGVGYFSANSYGKKFDDYASFSKQLFIVGMIETKLGVENLEEILQKRILDSVIIGPYDLSASLGCTGNFNDKRFVQAEKKIFSICSNAKIPYGIHIVEPDKAIFEKTIKKGAQFIGYGGDSIFLNSSSKCP